jgi:imidazolonepropionase-like amidohydrolase
VARSAAKIVRAGGKVSISSHGELGGGLTAHWDLWMLAMGGFTPHEALRASTLTGAQKIGFERDLGSLEAGKMADFVVLNSNPLDDIRNTADIQYVVKNGCVFDAESMTQLHPQYRPLPKPFWHSDEDWERYRVELPPPL